MELFTATRKQKKFFDSKKSSMCAPRVTWHTSIRYSSSCHIRVNMGASIFFAAAMIRAFRHPDVRDLNLPLCDLHSRFYKEKAPHGKGTFRSVTGVESVTTDLPT
jgi:hypothetical protein